MTFVLYPPPGPWHRPRTSQLCHLKSLPMPPWPEPDIQCPVALSGHTHLHELQVLVGQLALGKLVFLGDPWVLEDLLGCEALVRVHV
jgi:hypothetical protein